MRMKLVIFGIAAAAMATVVLAQQAQKSNNDEKAPPSSYSPVVEAESFSAVRKRMEAAKVEGDFAPFVELRDDLVELLRSEIAGAYLIWMTANARAPFFLSLLLRQRALVG